MREKAPSASEEKAPEANRRCTTCRFLGVSKEGRDRVFDTERLLSLQELGARQVSPTAERKDELGFERTFVPAPLMPEVASASDKVQSESWENTNIEERIDRERTGRVAWEAPRQRKRQGSGKGKIRVSLSSPYKSEDARVARQASHAPPPNGFCMT